MSAEHTQLSGDSVGQIRLNNTPIEVYQDPINLPCDETKRTICEDHIAKGLDSEVVGEFWMNGCDFPKKGDEQMVRLQLSCAGLSKFRKHCRLTLTQYDRNGKELNKGSVNQQVS